MNGIDANTTIIKIRIKIIKVLLINIRGMSKQINGRR